MHIPGNTYESNNKKYPFFCGLTQCRNQLKKDIDTEFPLHVVRSLIAGTNTNKNENGNSVNKKFVNKETNNANPSTYLSQTSHGVSQSNKPYTQLLDKMTMMGMTPTETQAKTVQLEVNNLNRNRLKRKQPGYQDPRRKRRRLQNQQNKNKDKSDTAYKSGAYLVK